jgi:hypothetical protein
MSPTSPAAAWPTDARSNPKPPRGRLPSRPTRALPGTPAKITAMTERAAQGESLFHPEDATLAGDWALLVLSPFNGKVFVVGRVDQRTRAVEIWPEETQVGLAQPRVQAAAADQGIALGGRDAGAGLESSGGS